MSEADIDELLEDYGPADDQIAEISKLAARAWKVSEEIETVDTYLNQLKSDFRHLTETLIPDQMAAAGVSNFTTDEGVILQVKDVVRASLPKDPERREEALSYLEDLQAGDLIKQSFKVDLERGEDNTARLLSDFLTECAVRYDRKFDVHPQTLAAFVREKMRNGEPVDTYKLGAFVARQANVKKAK